jgi:hypothetical protein
MRKDDDLKPGVDKPTRAQYVIGAVLIVILSLVTYWWLAHRDAPDRRSGRHGDPVVTALER